MAEVTFGGLATGLPTDEIVTKLMAVQRRPLERLESDKEYEAMRLKAYSQLNSRLGDLRKAADAMNITSEVRTTKVELGSETNFKATSANAGPGSYNISVAQLAQVQKDISAVGYASKTASAFKTGTIAIKDKLGVTTQATITIDATNNSLQGIQAAINAQSETTGISATIIGNDESNYRLSLTGKDSSTSYSLDTAGLSIGIGEALNFTNTQAGQKAVVIIDGAPVVSNSNTITDAISGVTLNLSAVNIQTSAGTPEAGVDSWKWAVPPKYAGTTMNVVGDTTALKEKISTFVSSYNKVMEWINEGYQTKTATDTATDTATNTATDTAKEEDILSDYLRGDSTVNNVKRGLQSILTDAVKGSGSLHILSDIGITTNKDGTLNLNNSKLDTALEGGVDGMVSLLAGEGTENGVMKKFNSFLVDLTSSTKGMYAEKKDRHKTRVERLNSQIAQKETMMEKIEKNMRARFNAMELLISNLNAQSSFLTQQMDALSNMGKN